MADMMIFPETVEEFMDQYKITDTEQIYTNGVGLVPIFRMKQWFDHKPERKNGKWEYAYPSREKSYLRYCTACGRKCWYCGSGNYNYCPNCGADMKGEQNDGSIQN